MIVGDQNGIILGYRVSLFDAGGSSLRNETVMDFNQLSHQFQDLEVWTNYSVKMCAFTSKGNGPYSARLPARTGEGGKKKNSAFLSVKVFSSKVLIDIVISTMSSEPRKSLVVWTAWNDFHF